LKRKRIPERGETEKDPWEGRKRKGSWGKKETICFLTCGLQVTHEVEGLNVEVQNITRSQAYRSKKSPVETQFCTHDLIKEDD